MIQFFVVLFLCLSAATFSPAQSVGVCDLEAGPQAIIRRATERERANFEKARNYTFIERVERRKLNSDGSVKSTDVRVIEFMIIYGEPVQRLISVNGKPISDKEKAKQDEKIEKLIRERESESEEQKQKRLAKYDKERAAQREFVEEIADAFNFTVLPSEEIGGRMAYVISAEPKRGYQPRRKQARILPKFHFRVWISAEDCNWIKLDAEAIDTLSYGGIVARVAKGTRIRIEQTRVNNEVWLPRHVALRLDARVMLLKKYNQDIDIAISEYRKFRAETHIVPGEPMQQ